MRVITLALILSFVFFILLVSLGVKFNTTKSIPLGFYYVSDEPAELGSYVMFCPPDTNVFKEAKARMYLTIGPCHGNYGYMMKKILAAKKDIVEINREGVFVNGLRLGLSRPLESDSTGALLPVYPEQPFSLKDDEILLMSDVSGTSFDARYFGPVKQQQIKYVIKPLIIW